MIITSGEIIMPIQQVVKNLAYAGEEAEN